MSELLQSTTDAPTGGWRTATVREVAHPTERTVVVRLDVAGRVPHMPGQHYVVRLTADDGYTASRSYSVASSPSDPLVELCVERLADGEVSSYLADVVVVGDELEVRGPIGGWFAWDGVAPTLAIGGGTGVVPLISMLRHARDLQRPDLVCLIAAARTAADLPYSDEAMGDCNLVALSRQDTPSRPAGRLTSADLAPHIGGRELFFVCGSALFAEAVGRMLVELGVTTTAIRVERFGPTS